MNQTLEEKRKLGSYFTKSEVITNYIVKRLELKNGLSVLEPSVGDGQFIKRLRDGSYELNITVFDINPLCIKHIKKVYQDIKIENKNTLLDNLGTYDRILGNPPYGAFYTSKEKKLYQKLYPEINVTESYALFLVNCIKRLKENGILSFIVSDTFLCLNNHRKLRKFILDNCKIKEIFLLKTKLFPDIAYQYAGLCIFTIQKCGDEKERLDNEIRFINRVDNIKILHQLSESNLNEIPFYVDGELIKQRKYEKFVNHILFQANIPNKILELFMDNSKLVGNLVECKTGIYSGDNKRHFRILETSKGIKEYINAGYETVSEKEIIKRTLTEKEKKEGIESPPFFVQLMKGGSGKYYKKPIWFIDWSKKSLNYMLNNKKARVQNSEYYFKKGICMSLINSNKQQARIMEEVIFDQSDNGYFPKDEKYLYFFLGFFNSQLFNYMLKKVINPTANATVNYVKKIPVLLPNKLQLKEINNLVKEIIQIRKINEETEIYAKEILIDEFFYDLYDLKKKDMEDIKKFCYHLR